MWVYLLSLLASGESRTVMQLLKIPVIAFAALLAVGDADDPTRDGWDTEAFNLRASAQLDHFKHVLQGDDAEPISTLADAGFAGTALFAESLTKVYGEGSILVQRGEVADSPAGGDLGQLVADWLKPYQSASLRRVKFKLYRVTPAKGHVTTEQYVNLTCVLADKRVEMNATWTIQWVDPGAEQAPRIRSIAVDDFEKVTISGGAQPMFTDCTDAAVPKDGDVRRQFRHGVAHWSRQIGTQLGIDAEGRYGIAVGDVNGDGLEDVYVCDGGALPNRLLLHQPDGTVVDASKGSGADWLESTTAALLVDLDNDGDLDLVLASHPAMLMLENDGHGKFTYIRTLAQVTYAFSLAAADYDLDGDLDIFACKHAPTGQSAGAGVAPLPYHDAKNGGRNMLLRNDGNFTFADATHEAGLDENNTRFSYAAAWEDYDNDGDADLYVANDYGRNNLYRNDGGRFTDVAAAAGVEDVSAGMSVAWGDYNNDGHMDLYVSNMFSAAGNRVTYQRRFKKGIDPTTLADYQRHARGNSLFENVGDGTFRDVSVSANTTMGRWAWSSTFTDINNDGLEDVIVANGYITNSIPDDL